MKSPKKSFRRARWKRRKKSNFAGGVFSLSLQNSDRAGFVPPYFYWRIRRSGSAAGRFVLGAFCGITGKIGKLCFVSIEVSEWIVKSKFGPR